MNKPLALKSLTITAKGQVTLRKSVLDHLGVAPGEKVALELLPDGRVAIGPLERKGDISRIFGMLAGKTNVRMTIEEMNEVIASGWAGKL